MRVARFQSEQYEQDKHQKRFKSIISQSLNTNQTRHLIEASSGDTGGERSTAVTCGAFLPPGVHPGTRRPSAGWRGSSTRCTFHSRSAEQRWPGSVCIHGNLFAAWLLPLVEWGLLWDMSGNYIMELNQCFFDFYVCLASHEWGSGGDTTYEDIILLLIVIYMYALNCCNS